MGNGSAFLVSFLLVGFVCVIVVEGADRCNFNASVPCFQSRGSANQGKMSVERLLSVFGRDEIDTLCNTFDQMKVCVKDKTKDCDSDDKNPLKKIWVKMQDSVNHVCVQNRQAFKDNRGCLTKQDVSSAVRTCETTHNLHRRYARHTCSSEYPMWMCLWERVGKRDMNYTSEYKETVKCVNDAFYKNCGSAGKNIMDRLVRNILSLGDIDHDCEQDSSGRRTEDSIVLRFILCTASFMLASLLN